MSGDAWFTLAVVLVTLLVLASERYNAALVMVAAVTVLLVSGVVDTKSALAGFSNEAPITIAALYVIIGAVRVTGALDAAARTVMGSATARPGQRRASRRTMARMLAPSMSISSFVSNTATVGLLAPQVLAWCRRTKSSPSWYLMGLNHAVTLGGFVTAIGCTTNIVVSGLMQQAGMKPMALLEISPIGIPVAVIGGALVVLVAPFVVPTRVSPGEQVADDIRDFVVDMRVPAGSPLAGRTVAEAGLRNLQGVFLVQMVSGDRTVAPVAPHDVLEPGCRLTFAGNVAQVLDLQRIPGLVSAEEPHFGLGRNSRHRFFEVVVSPTSKLVGSTLAELGFRGRYEAAVLAIHRAGARVPGKLGTVRLRAGDVLLVVSDPGWGDRIRGRGDFSSLSALDQAALPQRGKSWVVGLVMLGFVVTAATGVLNVLTAALLSALIVVLLGVLTPGQARESVDLEIIVLLAASFGLGNAMAETGLAREIAQLLIHAGSGMGDVGVLLGVLVSAVLITQLVTNNAAAVIMFPIAMAAASGIHASPRSFAFAVAFGASTSFLTPIAYQTNLMVQGMAGYKFADFLPLGAVLVTSTTVIAGALLPVVFPLH